MAVKRITWRWLLNSFGVIVIIILALEIVFAFGISSYYYNSVRQTLRSRAELVNSVLSQYRNENPAGFLVQMRDYVAVDFPDRERMELMTIDASGEIYLTSSGFVPDDKSLPDYKEALASETKAGEYIGTGSGGRIMAVSYLSSVEDTALSAVRFVVSLENVDKQITFWIVSMCALGLGILALVLFSSSYFIGTIVNPLGEVSNTARSIANGNFNAHLEKQYNDEIGDLCDTINDMAQKLGEAEQMKNDFISSVSHELRTPLTAIQGWGETLMADGGQDKEMLRKGIGIINSETVRLSKMVEELLDFSRMQSGRLTLELSKVDALAELSDVVLMYTEQAKRSNIKILYEDSDLIVPVIADKDKLRQVFVNIIDNAVKYSDPGCTIRVSAGLSQQVLTMVVADNGIGIKKEDLPKVKTKFFKVSSTRRSSGIGLAVADEIIRRHGGELNLQSVYGEGTTVTIKFPLEGPEHVQQETNH